MSFGDKIIALKDSGGFKDFQQFGRAVGLNGDWLLDLSKREQLINVDILKLKKITDYFSISIDELLEDQETVSKMEDVELKNDDIGILFNEILIKLKNTNVLFYGNKLNKTSKKIIGDSINLLYDLVNDNLKKG